MCTILSVYINETFSFGETNAFEAAKAEKRSDAFNTMSNSAAIIPTTTLNEVVKQARDLNGLYN